MVPKKLSRREVIKPMANIKNMKGLNHLQKKNIQKMLDNLNSKTDMDVLAEQFTEILLLSGLNNGQAAYVLTNSMRHLINCDRNKERVEIQLKELNPESGPIDLNNLSIDDYVTFQRVWAKEYRCRVDKQGKSIK